MCVCVYIYFSFLLVSHDLYATRGCGHVSSGNIWRRKADELKSQKADVEPRDRNMGTTHEEHSQLAGCSPNRRISWSCVNFTKVSYCSAMANNIHLDVEHILKTP